MLDIMYLAIITGFFVLSLAYLGFCRRLKKGEAK